MTVQQLSMDMDGQCRISLENMQTGPCSQDDDKVIVIVEVCMKASSTVPPQHIEVAVSRFLDGRSLYYKDAVLDFSQCEEPLLLQHVQSMIITGCDPALHRLDALLLCWQISPKIYIYQVSEEGCAEDDEGEDGVPSYREWTLPTAEWAGSWEALHYDSEIKGRLLRYANSALLFADHGVDGNLVSWNRVVLLHGPPGTGKTSLCKALAQKLTIRFSKRYRQGALVEVNAHSLFSKWFSESGKLVSKLFSKITELVEEQDCLVFVLIDEVESLTAARKAAVSGSEPTDAIRAVNALLTQLDQLRRFPNVMVLTTSNITEAIDAAFVDRADIKAYIGPPTLHARYEIMRSAVQELARAGIIAVPAACSPSEPLPLLPFHSIPPLPQQPPLPAAGLPTDPEQAAAVMVSHALLAAAAAAEGLSGRSLRKLPFLAHATAGNMPVPCSALAFIQGMKTAAENEQKDRQELCHG